MKNRKIVARSPPIVKSGYMAQIISVIQQKGGVGKTTISINLAFELATRYPSLTVAIADADKQQSALKWVAKDSIVKVVAVNEDGEGATLRDELNNIEADFIVLDCPGVLGAITLRAAMYADVILVPVGQGINNLRATQAALSICNEAKDFDPAKEILLVPSNIKNTTSAGKRIRTDIQGMGQISRVSISQRQDYEMAQMVGGGVSTYAPNSMAHNEVKELLTEVFELLNIPAQNSPRNRHMSAGATQAKEETHRGVAV